MAQTLIKTVNFGSSKGSLATVGYRIYNSAGTPNEASKANLNDLQSMIQPLGLSERRSKTLIRMSNDYISKHWRDSPEVLYGIGKYGSDAYRIFCLGEWRNVQPKDHALNDYHSWLIENKN